MSRLARDGRVSRVSASEGLGAALNFRPILGETGFGPIPPLELAEAEDEREANARAERLGYELDVGRWRPISVAPGAARPPTRFVDGSVTSVTAGVCSVEGTYRPLLVGSLGAAELFLSERRLHRPDGGYKVRLAAAIVSNGMTSRLLEQLKSALADMGIQLLALESSDLSSNFEVLRRRTWDFLKQEMEGLEREILLARPEVPTLADGLLERRLTTIQSQEQPVIGMVKRNLQQYLPNELEGMLYELRGGQRSPAFLIKTPHAELVSWYLRISEGPFGPGGGLVRLAVPRQYLEHSYADGERFHEISGVSHRLCEIRCREESYGRHYVSLEPIVRLEEQLRALLPRLDRFAARVRNRLAHK